MADGAQPPAPRRGIELAPDLLRRLMAEGGWSTRSLSRATERAGRRLGASSIGNIAGGRDQPGPAALEVLARAMGHDPEIFLEVRLARVRRLFDERELDPQAADENYRALAAVFPGATRVDALIETVDEPAGFVTQAIQEAAQRSAAPDVSPAEGSPRQTAEPQRARARRPRQRRA